MRIRPITWIWLLLLCACLVGCTWRPDAKAAKVNLDYWVRIAPYAKAGIDKDATLNANSKRIRKRSVDSAVTHARAMKDASQ